MVARAVMASLTLLLPVAGAEVFDVRTFGATGDGVTYDTGAVRAAAAALASSGGGTLLFSCDHDSDQAQYAQRRQPHQQGCTFLTGAFNLSSNAHLEVPVGATVLGSSRGADWPVLQAGAVWPQFGHGSDCTPGTPECARMHQAFVFAWDARNVSVGGGGTIDANASAATWWGCAKDLAAPPCDGAGRPHLMMFSNVTGVELAGVTIRNSPDWTVHMSSVTDLYIHGITVHNPGTGAPNSDGIDLDCVQNALVENCTLTVGDDALCIKSGIDFNGRQYRRPTRDVVLRDIIIGSGHGISVGSETSGGVFNVTFEAITMNGTANGPRIKSQRGRGGLVDGVTFRNITAVDLAHMISFTQEYHTGLPPTNATATPRLRNVLVDGVRFTGPHGADAGIFVGLAEAPIVNITLHDVDFNGGDVKFGDCKYVTNGVCSGTTTACPPCFVTTAKPQ